jgi:4'-phosphopantetheinyl transferase
VQTIYWTQQSHERVPAGDSWLDSVEIETQSRLRIPKRLSDWRLGRWTAKRAAAAYLKLNGCVAGMDAVGIRAASDGAPEAVLRNAPAPLSISISHSAGFALCAVAEPTMTLGCDLETVEPRSEAFSADYFTPEEHKQLEAANAPDRWRLLTALWSAKESAMKALRAGLRVDTRTLNVGIQDSSEWRRLRWMPLEVHLPGDATLRGWWDSGGAFVRTVVAEPAPAEPVRLVIG